MRVEIADLLLSLDNRECISNLFTQNPSPVLESQAQGEPIGAYILGGGALYLLLNGILHGKRWKRHAFVFNPITALIGWGIGYALVVNNPTAQVDPSQVQLYFASGLVIAKEVLHLIVTNLGKAVRTTAGAYTAVREFTPVRSVIYGVLGAVVGYAISRISGVGLPVELPIAAGGLIGSMLAQGLDYYRDHGLGWPLLFSAIGAGAGIGVSYLLEVPLLGYTVMLGVGVSILNSIYRRISQHGRTYDSEGTHGH